MFKHERDLLIGVVRRDPTNKVVHLAAGDVSMTTGMAERAGQLRRRTTDPAYRHVGHGTFTIDEDDYFGDEAA